MGWLAIVCRKCSKTDKVASPGSEGQLLSELCGKCYRDAFTKAHKEKPVKCKGCKEPFAKSLLDGDGRCEACQIAEDPAPAAPNSKALYQATSGDETLVFTVMSHRASTVMPEVTEYIWDQRLPVGKLGLINGAQGSGKSTLFCDIIGRVTTGRDWPDGAKNTMGVRRVLMASTEDDEANDIIPRLMAAGANLDLVELLDKVQVEAITKSVAGNVLNRGKKKKVMLDLKLHTKLLKGIIKKYPDVSLILLDPITAFLGVDECKDKENRPVLESVKEALEGSQTVLIGTIHSNKMTAGSAGDKMKGGSSMLGVPRVAWVVGRDPDDKSKRYMALIKGNGLKKETGLTFTIENKVLDEKTGLEAGCVVWDDQPLDADANDMLVATRESGRENNRERKRDKAKDLILSLLENAPMRSTDVYDAGEKIGISGDTTKEAARQLMKEVGLIRKQRNDGWWMGLAEHKELLDQKDPTIVEDAKVMDVDQL